MKDLVKISLYKSVLQTIPLANIHLRDFYYAVMSGDYEDEINEIRSYPHKAKELKKSLPGVTISGTFRERNTQGLVQHSGRICIDIDGKENPHLSNWSEIRNTLGTWKEIEFCSLSASGNGLMAVVKIEFQEKHLSHFMALESAFMRQGIKIDSLCKDIPRLRFITSDRDAIINENTTAYRILQAEPKKQITRLESSGYKTRNLIKEILSQGLDITQSYKQWFEIGCALANEYGELGRNDFHLLSRNYPGYKQTECDRQYDNCIKNRGGYTIATLFYFAKQSGISVKEQQNALPAIKREGQVLTNPLSKVNTYSTP
jgi:Primase C terminal 2 (PriCT-2)/BT4734-like, N-terminal domain